MSRTDTPTPRTPSAMRAEPWMEPLLAAILAAALYAALYGELPYHDASRFENQVNSGRFVWDIAHILMQPATLLWHQYLGFGEPAAASQKHINTIATAAGIGVFYALLLRLRVPGWARVFATLLVAASGSLLTLAPSAHMKLLAFPFVNLALFTLTGWEQALGSPALDNPTRSARGRLALAAALLALAASFLASVLATAPFATLAVWLIGLRRGQTWRDATANAALFAIVCGLTFLMLACAGYAVFTGLAPSLHGLTGSVTEKSDLRPAGYNLAANLARLVFGTANNIADAPDLGAIARAWLSGAIPSLRPYRAILLVQAGPWLLTLALLTATYAVTARCIVSGTRRLPGTRCLVPAAFLCGAQTWTIYYGLNDPEHWFQLTVPSVCLLLILFPSRFVRVALPIWACLTAAVNIGAFAAPYAAYPVAQSRAALLHRFGPNDLLIGFVAYSGHPSLDLINLPTVPQLMLDEMARDEPGPDAFYADLSRRIRDVLARGGRVVVFGGVLDPLDWNAPWSSLPAHGITKRQMNAFFHDNFAVRPLGMVVGIPAWEIGLASGEG